MSGVQPLNSKLGSDQIFIDIPTGHEITRMVPLEQHHKKCSAHHGFMCDCAVLKAAQYAVDKAKERLQKAEKSL